MPVSDATHYVTRGELREFKAEVAKDIAELKADSSARLDGLARQLDSQRMEQRHDMTRIVDKIDAQQHASASSGLQRAAVIVAALSIPLIPTVTIIISRATS